MFSLKRFITLIVALVLCIAFPLNAMASTDTVTLEDYLNMLDELNSIYGVELEYFGNSDIPFEITAGELSAERESLVEAILVYLELTSEPQDQLIEDEAFNALELNGLQSSDYVCAEKAISYNEVYLEGYIVSYDNGNTHRWSSVSECTAYEYFPEIGDDVTWFCVSSESWSYASAMQLVVWSGTGIIKHHLANGEVVTVGSSFSQSTSFNANDYSYNGTQSTDPTA